MTRPMVGAHGYGNSNAKSKRSLQSGTKTSRKEHSWIKVGLYIEVERR